MHRVAATRVVQVSEFFVGLSESYALGVFTVRASGPKDCVSVANTRCSPSAAKLLVAQCHAQSCSQHRVVQVSDLCCLSESYVLGVLTVPWLLHSHVVLTGYCQMSAITHS